MMMFWALVSAFLLGLPISLAESPPVQVSLRAPWSTPPLLLEVIEFISREQDVNIFEFISNVTTNTKLLAAKETNSQTIYKEILNAVTGANGHQYISRDTSLPLLKLALSLHSNAPLVQAHYQYYEETVVPQHTKKGKSFNRDCDAWVDWYGVQACNVQDLNILVSGDRGETSGLSESEVFAFDHVYHSSSTASSRTAILYADLYGPTFPKLHKRLMELAQSNVVTYILRYKPPASGAHAHGSLHLSGYGAELALKSTEYKVTDDRNADKEDSSSESSTSAAITADTPDPLHEDIPSVKPVAKDEVKNIGFRTAQYILDSADPLHTFAKVTQNFPKYAHILSTFSAGNESLREEILHNVMLLRRTTGLWLNGLEQDLERLDAFSLLRTMRAEADLVSSLTTLGMMENGAIELLTTDLGKQASVDATWGTAFDVRSDAVLWWNNLEKDTKYQRWPASVRELLRPSMPGQLKYFRRNAFNLVFFLDFTNEAHLQAMQMLFQFMNQNVPMRVGVVPLFNPTVEDHPSTIAARSFYQLVEFRGRKAAKRFLDKLADEARTQEMTAAIVKSVYQKIHQTSAATSDPKREKADLYLTEAKSLFTRLGIQPTDDVFFINGKQLELVEGWQRTMVGVYFPMLEYLTLKVYSGEVDDRTNLEDFFLTLPNVYPRRNSLIFGPEPKIIDVTRGPKVDFVDKLDWIYNDPDIVATTSIVVVADYADVEGVELARNALSYAVGANATRITFLHNQQPAKAAGAKELLIHEAARAVATRKGEQTLQSFLAAAESALVSGKVGLDFVKGGDSKDWVAFNGDGKAFVADVFGLGIGDKAVVVNGRVVGPIKHAGEFEAEDFKLLAKIEAEERYENVANKAVKFITRENKELDSRRISDLVYKASSIVVAAATEASAKGAQSSDKIARVSPEHFNNLQRKYCGFRLGNLNTATFRFTAVVDPVTDAAQKLSALLNVVASIDGVAIDVILSPTAEAEEKPPLARFYRYVLKSELEFDGDGNVIEPVADFKDVPVDPLLTLGSDVPGAWLVFPTRSVHDLDNIRLSSLKGDAKRVGVKAEFVLENILVEGHARDSKTQGPPRGLQFTLGTESHPYMVDTITMANLGYLQLKANPGVWDLRLRAGKSKELYDIESVGDSYRSQRKKGLENKLLGEEGARISVTSFEGVTVYPVVRKKSGKESEDLLDEEGAEGKEGGGGIWKKVKGSLFKSHKKKNVVNVFSVASGHLYERFLSIMMLSVKKSTKSDVKFWLIENFLSPSFMEFIPHLAKEYGFEYEFVTYKWPHWLRAQTEKQRTIWGYKILFLDVLFPLDLDRVIFVDADQVVRTDLQELVDMDLQGAVYGYTPFCDDRQEMDGFRFWKHGYWQNHLGGLPYHISALYVVDLVRFRQVAAGDRIRQQYQMLSADPNSLANLDQDLPNNMQHSLPIFSLPQEWLWCETWCSDESLKKAKTIDLCNNPLTKEPKLERAKRILPEWEGLDNEVAAVAKRLQESGKGKDSGDKRHKGREGENVEKDEL